MRAGTMQVKERGVACRHVLKQADKRAHSCRQDAAKEGSEMKSEGRKGMSYLSAATGLGLEARRWCSRLRKAPLILSVALKVPCFAPICMKAVTSCGVAIRHCNAELA